MNFSDAFPALSALFMIALVVWNGFDTVRQVEALRAERRASDRR